jgi:hypothetical protein
MFSRKEGDLVTGNMSRGCGSKFNVYLIIRNLFIISKVYILKIIDLFIE